MELIACLRHVLTSQIHRRFNRNRAITTTQRRLKRLSDAGLVERLQFHRRDGGGVPMCYVITEAGMALLLSSGRRDVAAWGGLRSPADAGRSRSQAAQRLRQARHEAHVAGWALAFETRLGVRR